MPSASKLVIDKKTNNYQIKRYWRFNINVDKKIDSIEKAVQGLYSRMDTISSKLDQIQTYFVGMSGGLSRHTTLPFLPKYIGKVNSKLFTYGFDKNF